MARLDAMPLVCVTWHDAHSLDNNEWHSPDDVTDYPCIVKSVGYWMKRPKAKHICLVQSCADDDGLDNVLLIPLGMVRKVERLKIPHKRRKHR